MNGQLLPEFPPDVLRKVLEAQVAVIHCMTVKEVAEHLKVSTKTVQRLMEKRDLDVVQIGSAQRVPFRSVLAYVERNTHTKTRRSA